MTVDGKQKLLFLGCKYLFVYIDCKCKRLNTRPKIYFAYANCPNRDYTWYFFSYTGFKEIIQWYSTTTVIPGSTTNLE